MTPLVDRMTVAGVGLIGGSLALAARRAGLVREVVGFGRTAANLDVALRRGLVDRVVHDEAAAADADLVVLAVPVRSCAPLAERMRPHARAGAVLTDVGSVKGAVVAALEAAWTSPGLVVGAHPIAGSERSGAGAADADLFRGARCVVTPTARTDAAALALVRRLWEGVGARVEALGPDAHDDVVARISHLPHLIAYALVRAVDDGMSSALAYAGPGFLDSTRIAASPPDVWRDIALANASALGAALGEFRRALDDLQARVDRGDADGLERAFAAAAQVRRRLGPTS